MTLYNKDFSPMLLSKTNKPFDDPNYLFELKYDGLRTLIFVSPNDIIIKSRNKEIITFRYPELFNIKKLVTNKVIFDGEIVSFVDGLPSFEKVKERVRLKAKSKIEFLSKNSPVVFIVFDIIYEDKDLTTKTLLERKKILSKYKDTDYFIKTEYFLKNGINLYKSVLKNNLEGIVAKKTDSLYQINKRSKDWLKIRNIEDDDFIIYGYNDDSRYVSSLLIGKKDFNFIGSVTIGKKNPDYLIITKHKKINNQLVKEEGYIPITPTLECTVEYLEITKAGKLRHPRFKTLKKTVN